MSVSWPIAHYYYALIGRLAADLGIRCAAEFMPGCMDYPPITTFRKYTVYVAAFVFVYRGAFRSSYCSAFICVRVSDKIPMKMLVSSISSGFGVRSCGACNVYTARTMLTAPNTAPRHNDALQLFSRSTNSIEPNTIHHEI